VGRVSTGGAGYRRIGNARETRTVVVLVLAGARVALLQPRCLEEDVPFLKLLGVAGG